MTAGWKAGFKKRPGAGDFLGAVAAELKDRKIEISRLKTGLERTYTERERQDRLRRSGGRPRPRQRARSALWLIPYMDRQLSSMAALVRLLPYTIAVSRRSPASS